MAPLKLNKILEFVGRAYEAGYNGCLELKDEYVEEVRTEVVKMVEADEASAGDFRLYSVQELRGKDFGTRFEHIRLGQGIISGTSDRNRVMAFDNGEVAHFMDNSAPWTEPMRELPAQ